jgi:hypothetical protein
MTTQATFTCTLRSKLASDVPGDKLLQLTQPATDITGHEWPRGTQYRLLRGGFVSSLGAQASTVSILATPEETSP